MKKSHNIKAVKKPRNTVAKEMKNSHIADDFASQRSDSNTDHTIKSHTINVDVNPIDNINSSDWIKLNIAIVSEDEWIKALNYLDTKTSISNELNISKNLNKMIIMILKYLYNSRNGLEQSNKLSYDLDGLN